MKHIESLGLANYVRSNKMSYMGKEVARNLGLMHMLEKEKENLGASEVRKRATE